MKKIILLTVIAFASYKPVFAQTLSLVQDTVATVTINSVDLKHDIINTTSSMVNMSWQVLDYSIAIDWDVAAICDYNQCYTFSAVSTMPVTTQSVMIPPYDSSPISVYFIPKTGAQASCNWVRLKIWDNANPSVYKIATYLLNCGPVGIHELNANKIVIYPNPADDMVFVHIPPGSGINRLSLHDLMGKTLESQTVSASAISLNLKELPRGFYFLRMVDVEGKIVSVKKIQH
jgi:hypothetical protein